MKIILNWLCFIGVIMVNALANILPINGLNTGQVSSFYPNAFVPAGFTFAIWGIIYLMLLSYTIAFTFYTFKQDQYKKAYAFIEQVNPNFLMTCVLNMAWIFAWHYLQIELSVVIMLFFLSTLIHLFLKSKTTVGSLNTTQRLLLYTPFMVYMGWISVATIANITALFVAYHWSGFGLSEMYWSAIMIFIALLLALVMIKKYQVVSFALVVAWAFWGIHAKQGGTYAFIESITTISIGYLLLMTFISFIKGFKKNKIA
jgi:benzodiazapine receptor